MNCSKSISKLSLFAGQSQVVSESRTEMAQFQYLEQKTSTRIEQQEETTAQAPVFTSSPKSIEVMEGQKAHFEARIIPVSDPSLRLEWFLNGQPIKLGSRFREGHDFGFVSLDISHVLPEDGGQYSCRATNNLGQAVCSANLTVRANQRIVKETLHESALQQINYLESQRSNAAEEEGFTSQAPVFTAQMRDVQVVEGSPAHFEAKLVPIGDPSLRVDWLKDGKPIDASNRMSFLHDFGFVALDLKYTRPGDSGRYSIRAINSLGQAEISANLRVLSGQGGADMESMHGEALSKIAYLERNKAKMDLNEDEAPLSAPKFVAQLQGKTQLMEGQNAHLECRVDPYPDATLKVEWFHDGKPLPFGNRWRTTYDFGFVALDILYAYPEDSGTYTCVAKNVLGESKAQCSLQVSGKSGLVLDTMDRDRLTQLRNLENRERARQDEVDAPVTKPVFTTPLNNVDGAAEGGHVHLECRLEPVNDPNLKVDWFINGKEIKFGSRFRTTHDFGYVALDIVPAYAEDSGTYMCKASNKLGEAVNTGNVSVSGKHGYGYINLSFESMAV